MTEAVRLVIWDLDETFWGGTLTEGGISYRRDAHNIVIELARRGIVSSICSKNNYESVKVVLQQHGIWEFFIMPSINWEPKGPRIARLVENVQLRPSTILFIDDNAMNLQEALHFVPELQIADQNQIENLLNDPRLVGKDDTRLTRLAQYRLLEQRYSEQQTSGGDTRDFLRSSAICVGLLHDLDPHVDRIVELINRTNQLNFTKKRLPDDMDTARSSVRDMLASFRHHCGIVNVKDRFGDHGLTGFFCLDIVANRLVHFCFSCRTQNMGIETWLYERLGRPALQVKGEVTTDIFSAEVPDWISLEQYGERRDQRKTTDEKPIGRVLVRGGCDLQVIAHYLGAAASSVRGEYHFHRFGKAIRVDHSACVRLALDGISEPVMKSLESIAYRREDFHTALAGPEQFDTYVFSFQSDAVQALYRLRNHDISVPFGVGQMRNSLNLAQVGRKRLESRLSDPDALRALDALLENFEFVGVIDEVGFKANLTRMLLATSPGARIFIILGNENPDSAKGGTQAYEQQARINKWIRDIAAESTRDVRPLNVAQYIDNASEMIDINHFAPKVYHRLSNALIASAARTAPS